MAVQPVSTTSSKTVCLVGNPNTGKSVVFGIFTGKYVTVSNYPGTTVELLRGAAKIGGEKYTIIDTPGTNSLIPMSEDERVTRDILLEQPPDMVLQIGDAKNLKRVLAITVQLAEMGLPAALALNMSDEARMRGIHIDADVLSRELGIPVVATVAVEHQGTDALMGSLESAALIRELVEYPDYVDEAVAKIADLLPDDCPSRKAIALMLLSGDDSLDEWLDASVSSPNQQTISDICKQASRHSSIPLSQVISRHRVLAVQKLYAMATTFRRGKEGVVAGTLGKIAMHPILGIPFLLLVLWSVWKFVGELGSGIMVNFLESTVFGEYINPAAIKLFSFVPFEIVRDLFVGEYGVITMALTYGIAIVLPIVFTFFLAFGVLEDSGYLPRLAVMVNNIFRLLGLNGKAVLPMVLGLGCDTMATLTTRILETPRERVIVTLLLALGVPCSAQLGVIMAMLTTTQSLVIWLGVIGVVLLIVGFLAGKLMPGRSSDFILEVPPLRIPKLSNIAVKTLARSEWYIKEAVPLFVIGTLVLFVLDATTVLGMIERASSPVVTGILGLPAETSRAFIMGFLRRDYGGAGLLSMHKAGKLTDDDILVSLVTITLFIPCIANFLVMIKERGWKTSAAMAAFIVPFAVLVGALVRFALGVFR